MKLDIPNAAFIFFLLSTPYSIVSLLHSDNIILALLGVALSVTWGFNGYTLASRISEQRKLQKILNSDLASTAIARLASVQGITREQAQQSVSNLAIGFSAEAAEEILSRFAMTIKGNSECKYNAQSPYLRCAVNPDGPCNSCQYFEKK